MPKSLSVAVVSGGNSSEREVSLRSGTAVFDAIASRGYKVTRIDPSTERNLKESLSGADLVFLTLHGAGGEDGTIQKKLDQWGIPYVGSNAASSRLSFDKILTKRILLSHNLPTADFMILKKRNLSQLEKFRLPFFVKPPQEGSSIGIYQVTCLKDALPQIRKSIAKYKTLLIERTIQGPEYTGGVIGNKALPIIEMRSKNAFYDYHAKYTQGMTDYLIPAPISMKLSRKLQRLALRTHKALGMRDLSRIDFKLDSATGKPYILEANSIPGFTALSLVPKAALYAGISFPDLCELLMTMAWKRVRQTKIRGCCGPKK